jgi:hypothetical protein
MLGTKCEWNGGLEDWKENRDNWRKNLFTKSKYSILFKTITILTNFMHKGWMDFTFEIIGQQMPNPSNHSWYGDFLFYRFKIYLVSILNSS